jgi:hypothetical protein
MSNTKRMTEIAVAIELLAETFPPGHAVDVMCRNSACPKAPRSGTARPARCRPRSMRRRRRDFLNCEPRQRGAKPGASTMNDDTIKRTAWNPYDAKRPTSRDLNPLNGNAPLMFGPSRTIRLGDAGTYDLTAWAGIEIELLSLHMQEVAAILQFVDAMNRLLIEPEYRDCQTVEELHRAVDARRAKE